MRVGIDLGTTFSAVARIDPETGKPQIIPNGLGMPTTPSVLCFLKNGEVLYGEEAKEMQAVGDENTASFFKRSMGMKNFALNFFGTEYSPVELSGILLSKLKAEAEEATGETIESAVVTVPAYFSHAQRENTMEAGRLANLHITHIINEPTAAAFAYGLHHKGDGQKVLIYDLGGGTFDVTIAEIGDDDITILGCDGDHELGGKDWDDCIFRYVINEFQDEHDVDISCDVTLLNILLVASETAKKQLSSRTSVDIPVSYEDVRGKVTITEEIFRNISQNLLMATQDVIGRLFASLSLAWKDIDGVILVGGSSRMKMVVDYVESMSGAKPLSGVNVDEAVALGAAIRANIESSGMSLPTAPSNKAASSGAVAVLGAKAIRDVTAHSMGMIVESKDRTAYINSVIIPKNSQIPAVFTQEYEFRVRGKDDLLEVYLLQGDDRRPLDNEVVGKYEVTGMTKGSDASSVILVSNRYTENGTIAVEAKQKDTGNDLTVTAMPVPEDMRWTDGSPLDNAPPPMTVGIVIALDMSGSMGGNPMRQAKQAILDVVNEHISDTVQFAVVPFADRAVQGVAMTSEKSTVVNFVNKLDVDRNKYGFCNDAHPFLLVRKMYQGCKTDVQYLIVLTDGAWDCQKDALKAAKQCHLAEIEIIALGFGTADTKFLKEISSKKDLAGFVDLSDLGSSFSTIARSLH